MKAVTEEGDEYHIIFTKDVVAQIPEWAQFEKNASKAGMVFSCSGAFVDGKFYVKMMP